jgi:formimidoylglutamase
LAALLPDDFDHPIPGLVHAPGSPAAAEAALSLVGVPFDTTTMGRRGSKHGPAAIRQALSGLLSYHAGFGVDLAESAGAVDYGDVEVVDTDVVETWRRISEVTRDLGERGRPLAVLGGDHGLTFPALRGLTEATDRSIALVSLDAHFDVRPHHRGQPASGVPFRYALEKLGGRVVAGASSQVGIAGWENSAAAATYLDDAGVRTFSARDVHRTGVDAIAAEVLERASGAESIWLTLDIDAVDAAYAPGTNAPTIGGLTSHQFLEFAWQISRTGRLAGFDVVEVSPPLDVAGITSLLGAQTFLTALAGVS